MVSCSLTPPPEYSLFCVCKWHQMSLSNTFLFLVFRLIWFVVWKMCISVCQFQKLAFYDEEMKAHETFWASVLLICVARLEVRNTKSDPFQSRAMSMRHVAKQRRWWTLRHSVYSWGRAPNWCSFPTIKMKTRTRLLSSAPRYFEKT